MEKLSLNSTVTLWNGVEMPLLGYSTEETAYDLKTQTEIILDAIEVGFRYFDTAESWHTQRALGRAVKMSGIPREEFFIASKISIDDIRDRKAYWAYEESLKQLDMDYLDLYSQHWAFTERQMSSWWKLEKLYDEGRVRAIGVCNHEIHHLERIRVMIENGEYTKYMPMVNQSHFHPQYTCAALREYCAANKIAFGGLFEKSELYKETKPRYNVETTRGGEWFEEGENPNIMENNPRLKRDYYDKFDLISEIAQKYGKTNSQICIRWSLQHGVITTPKTTSLQKMKEYIDVFDFELTGEEMEKIDRLNINNRIGYDPDYIDF
ncbi:MAG: aldo/keto reductase [Eubacteriales bacterium]|nr:aldo/keto reductase [Eubacteriales bacterium]